MNKIFVIVILIAVALYAQVITSKKFIGVAQDARYVQNVRPYVIGESEMNLWIKTDSTAITIQCPKNKPIPLCLGDSIFIYTTEYDRRVGIENSTVLYKIAR